MNLITHLTPQTTSQELFDYVTSFLLKQGEQSRGPGGACAYRGRDGLMCAVGCVVPDEFYSPSMEGEGIDTVLAEYWHSPGKQRPFWRALAKHSDSLRMSDVVTLLKMVKKDAEPNNWLRGYYCAVAQALREEGGTTTLIESLFRNGGDWREADPEDIALFKQHGLTKDN